MPGLKDIIANITEYGDDEEIEVKGVKVKIGDLRSYAASENQATIAAINERKAALDNFQTELQQQAESVAALQAELEATKGRNQGQGDLVEQFIERLRGPQKKTMMDLVEDEFFGPAAKAVREMQTTLQQREQQLQQALTRIENDEKWMVQRELQRTFDSIPDKPKELTLRQLADHAMKRRYVGDDNFPDLRRAYEDIQEPVIREKTKKQLRAEVEAEVRAEARKPKAVDEIDAGDIKGHVFVPRPSGGNGNVKAVKPKGYGGIDKIPAADILADPQIAALFQQ